MGKRDDLARLQSQRGLDKQNSGNNPNAIDMFLGEYNSDKQEEFKNISLDKLQPFKNHIFHLYEGERLDEMVNSIRISGVITPIIVRPLGNYYEILAGHNRKHGSDLAELLEIPAIIKYGLSDDEAELITITTNLNQRSIDDMKISELAIALMRQNELLKHQGRKTSDHDEPKLTTDRIGNSFKLSSSNVKRYIRLTNLSDELLQMIDSSKLNFVSGVSLSYLRKGEMKILYDYIVETNFKITPKIAEQLKKLSDESDDNIDVKNVLYGFNKTEYKPTKIVKFTMKELSNYIPNDQIGDYKNIMIKALEAYYKA